jgi:dinuclear metal center YbgI/SA1388 family protein
MFNQIIIDEVVSLLEEQTPLYLQESYDNCGLLIGDRLATVTNVLLTLDVTMAVLEEAKSKNCNLIVAHHPLVFLGLKKLTGSNYTEQAVLFAIKNDIAVYAIHTNLDNKLKQGVNEKIAEKLGLIQCKVLLPKQDLFYKLVTFCPHKHAEKLRDALFGVGAGQIGNYDSCSFNTNGFGTFKANESANPFVGNIGQLHKEDEVRIEMIFPRWLSKQVQTALRNAHPYEEAAFDIIALQNQSELFGSGLIGSYAEPVPYEIFLDKVAATFKLKVIRYSGQAQSIQTVALCGGSGSFLIQEAKKKMADAFITSDLKYHQFFDAEDKILLADIGHYESEQFTPSVLFDTLREKFSTFALIFSEIITNPIEYRIYGNIH